MKKILLFIFVFYVLALFQTSFLVHFSIFNIVPNFIFILIFTFNFIERPDKKLGFFVAGIGGFYLDLFSGFQIGTSIIVLLFLAYLIKRLLNFLMEENIVLFLPCFVFFYLLYKFLLVFVNSIFEMSFSSLFVLDKIIIFDILYNLIFSVFIYSLIKICLLKIIRK